VTLELWARIDSSQDCGVFSYAVASSDNGLLLFKPRSLTV
jgi:hypothetical protein